MFVCLLQGFFRRFFWESKKIDPEGFVLGGWLVVLFVYFGRDRKFGLMDPFGEVGFGRFAWLILLLILFVAKLF